MRRQSASFNDLRFSSVLNKQIVVVLSCFYSTRGHTYLSTVSGISWLIPARRVSYRVVVRFYLEGFEF